MSSKSTCIGLLYQKALKPMFFAQDPEVVHNRFVRLGHYLGKHHMTKRLVRGLFSYRESYHQPALTQTICGLQFQNPVGLSAGFDKDGYLSSIMEDVGFGFTEIGTVTYQAYEGNPRPRLARLPALKALIVNYGLKNDGVQTVINRLRKNQSVRHLAPYQLSHRSSGQADHQTHFVQGISIGRTNLPYTHTREAGIQDYVDCLTALRQASIGDYYTLNISCPNTCGGESFTTPEPLEQLLQALSISTISQPTFIKLPIDLPWEELRVLITIAVRHGIKGIIIGNLTKNRKLLQLPETTTKLIPGGISGKPTVQLSNHLIAQAYQEFGDQLTIIGVGGIFSAEDAYEKIKLGASLVQLITGMVYQGPQLIGEINRGLTTLMRADGFTSIREVVGSAHTKIT